ncbi:MAG: transglycosylase domain-containing protein [Acidaminococcaceae bacterium]|jgi:penicillin-binding protein 1A|nr:transglycosylase domain-containing protein [Acidaminococcaceae bacterium]MCI2109420.1 transglycosylase domain-containing protein [Acidaminococcaceae bacterium]
MKKLIAILFVLSAFLCYKATRPVKHSAPSTSNNSQATEKAPTHGIDTGNIIPTVNQWPQPVSRFYHAYYLKNFCQEKIGLKDWVSLEKTPKNLQHALVSIEDKRFYEHHGIDADGILRATLVNIQEGGIVQGGSTLTQQLVKNNLLSDEQTIGRKVQEASFAFLVESRYSKEEILEMYFNTTYFGGGATGIKQAAKTFFGLEPFQLSLSECAVIAGLPNAPSALNPLENPEGCLKRRNLVLKAMGDVGYLRKDEVTAAQAEPLGVKEK